MKTKKRNVIACLLAVLIALLFALTCIPGAIHVYTMEGSFYTDYYTAAFMCNSFLNVLAGALLGCALIPAIAHAVRLSRKSITVCAVILEMSALFSLSQIFAGRMYPPSVYTPLSYGISAATFVAAAIAFVLTVKTPYSGKENRFSEKQMALFSLAIAAVFALTFLKWGWRWKFLDGGIVDVSVYSIDAGLWALFSAILTVFALNIAILHAVGFIKGPPSCCAGVLICANALMIIRILLTFVSSDTTYTDCVPRPMTYVLVAAQLAIAVLLLVGNKGKKHQSSTETSAL